jgi:hypothetical protein
MRRVPTLSLVSLVPVLLSVGFYWAAAFFHAQYAQANGIVARAIREAKSRGDAFGSSLTGLPSPETYFMRAELMFLAAILVCALAAFLALRRKHWLDWSALLVVVAITLAIPFHLLWRS